jgi:2-polyprenyl-3-methyl-5-hydroxy-6-metoxy-1,4-benzoquinol methylase
MELDEKTSWNKKYSEGSHTSLEPDPLLVTAYDEFLTARPPGAMLDVAGGVGRHAIWLAKRGWRARLLDISEVGIGLAEKNASRALGPVAKEFLITAEVADLNSVQDLGREEYDVVLVFYYLQRELFPALISALKPGGLLIYKTYTTEQQRCSGGLSKSGPSHPMFLLEPNELLRAFQPLRILHYHETITEKGVAELVGMK